MKRMWAIVFATLCAVSTTVASAEVTPQASDARAETAEVTPNTGSYPTPTPLSFDLESGVGPLYIGHAAKVRVESLGGYQPPDHGLAPPRRMSVSAGELPPGLVFERSGLTSGEISGVVEESEPKEYRFTLKATQHSVSVEQEFSLTTQRWEAPGRFQQIASTEETVCGVNQAHKVYCWGADSRSESSRSFDAKALLGNGVDQETDRAAPVPVKGINGRARRVAVGFRHSCALTVEGSVWCWGANTGGAWLPQPSQEVLKTAHQVPNLPPRLRHIAVGHGTTCVANTEVYCWGYRVGIEDSDDPTELNLRKINIPDRSHVVSLTSRGLHSCAAFASGNAWCWGVNAHGQLAQPANEDNDQLVRIPSHIGRVKEVKVAYKNTCALTVRGDVWCWGNSSWGQAGESANKESQHEPRKIDLKGHKVRGISASSTATCATTVGGQTVCFGWAPGIGWEERETPSWPEELNHGVQHTINSDDVTCGLLFSGLVKCGGGSLRGAVGNNTFSDAREFDYVKQFD